MKLTNNSFPSAELLLGPWSSVLQGSCFWTLLYHPCCLMCLCHWEKTILSGLQCWQRDDDTAQCCSLIQSLGTGLCSSLKIFFLSAHLGPIQWVADRGMMGLRQALRDYWVATESWSLVCCCLFNFNFIFWEVEGLKDFGSFSGTVLGKWDFFLVYGSVSKSIRWHWLYSSSYIGYFRLDSKVTLQFGLGIYLKTSGDFFSVSSSLQFSHSR